MCYIECHENAKMYAQAQWTGHNILYKLQFIQTLATVNKSTVDRYFAASSVCAVEFKINFAQEKFAFFEVLTHKYTVSQKNCAFL